MFLKEITVTVNVINSVENVYQRKITDFERMLGILEEDISV